MVNFIIKYFHGLTNQRCLVQAKDEADAMRQFLQACPGLRAYNVISVTQSAKRVHQLGGR